MSASEIARKLHMGLSTLSYHVKELAKFEALVKTDTVPRRGAEEIFYASTVCGDKLILHLLEQTREEDEKSLTKDEPQPIRKTRG